MNNKGKRKGVRGPDEGDCVVTAGPMPKRERKMSDCQEFFTDLFCDEVLLAIFKLLMKNHQDIVNVSQVCQRLDNLLKDQVICSKILFYWNLQLSKASFTKFLKDHDRAAVVRSLTLTDLYWIPSMTIKDVIQKMVNLEELLVAGTTFSWKDLKHTLKSKPKLQRLAWSWDNALEKSPAKRNSLDCKAFMELIEMKPYLQQLKCFLIDFPIGATVEHSSLSVLLSFCNNLEQLWILSSPKATHEDTYSACSDNMHREGLHRGPINMPKLHTLVVDVKHPPRLSSPQFITFLLNSFLTNESQPKVVWVDHTLLGTPRRYHTAMSMNPGLVIGRTWPQEVDASKVERLSYPLMCQQWNRDAPDRHHKLYPKLKKLQISHGAPTVINVTNLFNESKDLETFICNTVNVEMDWKRFAETHKKLQELSISVMDKMKDFFESVATFLPEIRRLSIPMECLFESKNTDAVAEYRLSQLAQEDSTDSKNKINDSSSPGNEQSVLGEGLFKRQRIGVTVKPSANPSKVSGLDLITNGCKKVEELEIGYGKPGSLGSTLARPTVVESLFSISRWKKLTKLSMSWVPIINGAFLIEITKSCNLESIRLAHLGLQANCQYIQELCKSLLVCKALQDFRLEQNHIGATEPLLRSLQTCSKLKRALIVSSPNSQPLEPDSVEGLFEKCPDLMMFYALVDRTTKLTCTGLRKSLERKYRACRPAISIDIRGGSLEEKGLSFNCPPSVHYRQMVVNESRICQLTEFPKNFDP